MHSQKESTRGGPPLDTVKEWTSLYLGQDVAVEEHPEDDSLLRFVPGEGAVLGDRDVALREVLVVVQSGVVHHVHNGY